MEDGRCHLASYMRYEFLNDCCALVAAQAVGTLNLSTKVPTACLPTACLPTACNVGCKPYQTATM